MTAVELSELELENVAGGKAQIARRREPAPRAVRAFPAPTFRSNAPAFSVNRDPARVRTGDRPGMTGLPVDGPPVCAPGGCP